MADWHGHEHVCRSSWPCSCNRPLDNDPYPFTYVHEHGLRRSCPYSWVDAIELKVREGGRVVNVSALIATAVNNDGHREILGMKLGSAETGASWTAFLK